MAEVLSAIDAPASAGAVAPSRACCDELHEKQPSAQGISTIAMLATVPASGHSSSDKAIRPIIAVAKRATPKRSMPRPTSRLPISAKAPKHRNRKLTCAGVACSTCR